MKKFIALIVTTLLFCLTTQVWAAPAAPLLSYETNGLNLTVSWTEVPGATGYTLHYAEYPYSPGDPIGSLDRGGATSFSIDLWVGAAFYLAVTAYDASNEESIFSNIEQFTIAEPTPEVPVLSYETDGLSISVSWTEVPDAAGYNLYFAPHPITGPDAFSHIDVGNQTSISYFLWENAAYYLSIKAYNGYGVEGESSNTELFIMGPPTPEWVDDDEDSFSEYDGDCDDTNVSINPDAKEICGDGIDQDCNGNDLACSEEPLTILGTWYLNTNETDWGGGSAASLQGSYLVITKDEYRMVYYWNGSIDEDDSYPYILSGNTLTLVDEEENDFTEWRLSLSDNGTKLTITDLDDGGDEVWDKQ